MWFNKGVEKISDLYVEGNLLSYIQLCEKYDIPRKHFFKYLQLKHFNFSTHKQLLSVPPLSKIEELTLSHINGGGQFSLFYELLLTYSKDSSSKKLEAWRIDRKEDSMKWIGKWLVLRPRPSLLKQKLSYYNINGQCEPILHLAS